jgi:hypothetical protein
VEPFESDEALLAALDERRALSDADMSRCSAATGAA